MDRSINKFHSTSVREYGPKDVSKLSLSVLFGAWEASICPSGLPIYVVYKLISSISRSFLTLRSWDQHSPSSPPLYNILLLFGLINRSVLYTFLRKYWYGFWIFANMAAHTLVLVLGHSFVCRADDYTRNKGLRNLSLLSEHFNMNLLGRGGASVDVMPKLYMDFDFTLEPAILDIGTNDLASAPTTHQANNTASRVFDFDCHQSARRSGGRPRGRGNRINPMNRVQHRDRSHCPPCPGTSPPRF